MTSQDTLPLQVSASAPYWKTSVYSHGAEGASEGTSGLLSSDDLKGQKYILYFYPKDNTPGCTTQACDFRDHMGRLSTLGYRVIGASPDSLKSHGRFQEKHGFSFELLSDPDHEVAEAFGVWREKKNYGRKYMGIVRSTFVINAEGIVTHALENVRAKGHVERLLKRIEEV
jgi:thioredoxin-dependent peroxiredoxin